MGVVMSENPQSVNIEFEELRNSVNQSSEHTKRQIDNIEKNAYIFGIISLLLSLGASYYLKIFEYWIPASFLLMYSWAFFSIKTSKKYVAKKTVDQGLEIYKKTDKEVLEHCTISGLNNLSAIMKSATIIYIVTVFILLAIHMNWIETESKLNILFPLVTCLFFIPGPYFLDNLIQMFKERGYQKFLDKIIHYKKIDKREKISKITLASVVLILIYIIVVLAFPIISFFDTLSLAKDWLLLLFVALFQFMLILLFSNYFSALTVKKELSNTITNYADINYLINDLILNKKCNRQELENLKHLYFTAKPYDYVVTSLFKYIQFYFLIPNRVYLKHISSKKQRIGNAKNQKDL